MLLHKAMGQMLGAAGMPHQRFRRFSARRQVLPPEKQRMNVSTSTAERLISTEAVSFVLFFRPEESGAPDEKRFPGQ